MGKYITIEQYNELSNGSFMFNREYFNECLERATGIKAQKYEIYSYYDENGNYIGDSRKMNIAELLKNASIKVTDDVAPVVHGRWLDCEVHNDIEQCSECGMIFHYPSYYGYKFCPNCGAKMDKEGK